MKSYGKSPAMAALATVKALNALHPEEHMKAAARFVESRLMDDLTHHHLTLYRGDWERLQEIYTNPRLTPTKVVRELVRQHLRRVADRLTDRAFTENAIKPPLSHGGRNE